MANEAATKRPGRSDRIVGYLLTATLLLGLLLFGRWFVGTIGGEFDRGGLLLALGLIVGSTAIRLIR